MIAPRGGFFPGDGPTTSSECQRQAIVDAVETPTSEAKRLSAAAFPVMSVQPITRKTPAVPSSEAMVMPLAVIHPNSCFGSSLVRAFRTASCGRGLSDSASARVMDTKSCPSHSNTAQPKANHLAASG